jgi:hypothetical protein
MAKTTAKTLSVALLSLAASTAVGGNNQGQQGQNENYQGQNTVSAPEIDPGQAMGALALLGGTLAIISGYRRYKK